MADNVAITAGSGTNIATDDIAGVHYQRMKLVDGTLDATTAIAAGGGVEAGALRVTVASDSTGVLSVDDNGSTLSVDDGGSTISVDDGGSSLTVDGTVTANAGTGFVSVQTEDAASAGGETGTMILGVRNDAAASKTSADGDFSAIATDSAGRVGIADLGGAISVDDNGSSLTVDGTVTANAGTGSFTVAQATAANLNATVVQATAANLNATVTGFGTTGAAAFVKITDGTNTATVNANGGLEVTGGVSHGATDAGNPLKLGAKAESSVTATTNVTDGQRTDLYADLDGVFLTKPFVPYGDIKVERVTDTGGTSTAFTTFGATASQRNYITTITVYNSSTTQGFIDLRDGTAGSVIFTIPLPALGGATINFPVPLRQATVNTALAYDVSAAITTAYISVVGFKGY